MNTPNTAFVQSAETIILPSGRDSIPCIDAFQQKYDIEVPTFLPRQLVVDAGNRKFIRTRGFDGPERIATGMADIALAGTDACEENNFSNIRFTRIGKAMCSFDVLAPRSNVNEVLKQISGEGTPLIVATSLPRLLGLIASRNQLNIKPAQETYGGSVEGAVAAGWRKAAADVVQSGETAEINGLTSVMKLTDIEPAVVWREPSEKYRPQVTRAAIRAIDETIRERRAQAEDLELTSYTIKLIKDLNEAIKKWGSEGDEALAAVLLGQSDEALVGELADVLYSGQTLVASADMAGIGRRRKELLQRGILESVLITEIERNQPSAAE